MQKRAMTPREMKIRKVSSMIMADFQSHWKHIEGSVVEGEKIGFNEAFGSWCCFQLAEMKVDIADLKNNPAIRTGIIAVPGGKL